MKTCVFCETQLKFMNTPNFGFGKLLDGNEVCSKCYSKINKISPSVAIKLKTHTTDEIKSLFEENEFKSREKTADAEKIRREIAGLDLPHIATIRNLKEIDEIPKILAPDEKLDNLVQGIYNGGLGILVSSDRRLVFIDKGMVFGLKVEDFPLDKISSIQYETGLLFGKLKIFTSGNTAVIDNVDKTAVKGFAEFVRDKIAKQSVKSEPVKEQISVVEQLEKLAKLKEIGVLTEEEFNEQKRKLLDKL